MSTELQKAEQTLLECTTAHGQANARLDVLNDRLKTYATQLSRFDESLAHAIEVGDEEMMAGLRRSRIEKETQHQHLTEEIEVLEGLVNRCISAERVARADLEGARRTLYAGDGVAVAEEIRSHLAQIVLLVEKMQLLDEADRRSRSIIRDCGLDSAVSSPIHTAGLTWIWDRLREIPSSWMGRLDSRVKAPSA